VIVVPSSDIRTCLPFALPHFTSHHIMLTACLATPSPSPPLRTTLITIAVP
jgi:hypothetical protein